MQRLHYSVAPCISASIGVLLLSLFSAFSKYGACEGGIRRDPEMGLFQIFSFCLWFLRSPFLLLCSHRNHLSVLPASTKALFPQYRSPEQKKRTHARTHTTLMAKTLRCILSINNAHVPLSCSFFFCVFLPLPELQIVFHSFLRSFASVPVVMVARP